jgi:hypothetical protein
VLKKRRYSRTEKEEGTSTAWGEQVSSLSGQPESNIVGATASFRGSEAQDVLVEKYDHKSLLWRHRRTPRAFWGTTDADTRWGASCVLPKSPGWRLFRLSSWGLAK